MAWRRRPAERPGLPEPEPATEDHPIPTVTAQVRDDGVTTAVRFEGMREGHHNVEVRCWPVLEDGDVIRSEFHGDTGEVVIRGVPERVVVHSNYSAPAKGHRSQTVQVRLEARPPVLGIDGEPLHPPVIYSRLADQDDAADAARAEDEAREARADGPSPPMMAMWVEEDGRTTKLSLTGFEPGDHTIVVLDPPETPPLSDITVGDDGTATVELELPLDTDADEQVALIEIDGVPFLPMSDGVPVYSEVETAEA
jgi:hypothetical protein